MRKAFIAVWVVTGLALVGCSGGDPCTAGLKCSADPTPTADQIKTCQDNLNKLSGDCKSASINLANCSRDATVCGSDNKTDATATGNAVTTNCATVIGEYTLKCAGNILTP